MRRSRDRNARAGVPRGPRNVPPRRRALTPMGGSNLLRHPRRASRPSQSPTSDGHLHDHSYDASATRHTYFNAFSRSMLCFAISPPSLTYASRSVPHFSRIWAVNAGEGVVNFAPYFSFASFMISSLRWL
jgi:hypothetical protein